MVRAITLKTQLGEKKLEFASISATEELGRLFSFQLTARSKDSAIDLRALLGTPMLVTATSEEGIERFFNGIVSEAGQTGFVDPGGNNYAEYRFVLVPKPWLLTRKTDSRIYKNISVPEIIKKVLGEMGYSDISEKLRATYPTREYCVQYRESYFNFISRLMEQEGIYYYFIHEKTKHTMVLCDGLDAHLKLAPDPELRYRPKVNGAKLKEWSITEFASERSVQTSRYQLADYDPLRARTPLLTTEKISNPNEHHDVANLDVFDYPGDYEKTSDGSRYAQVCVESLNAAHSMFVGATDALTLNTGCLFKLKEFSRKELDQEYLVTGSTIRLIEETGFSGGDGSSFSISFHAISGKQPFRSLQSTPRSNVTGLQTAFVCGSKEAEDIVVDKYGRVQVIFHWSRTDKPNHDVSCPVRVSTPWAGKQWGAVHIPRVGQEVVVSFLEGDPDRPLIVGSVYNSDNMPPYELPAKMTQSGIKSRSHKGGGAANFNEIRFEDKMGSEELFIHAEKDMREEVEHDHFVDIGNDETLKIKINRTHDIGQEDKLSVGANSTTDVKQKFKLTAGTEIELVTGASSIKMTASGDIEIKGVNIKITGNATVAINGTASAELASSGKTDVKGTMLNLNGSAMAKLGGGITMIG